MQLPYGKRLKSLVATFRSQSGSTLASFWLAGFLGVALVLVLASLVGVLAWLAGEQAAADQEATSWAEVRARSVASRVATVQAQLGELASDPGLRQMFRDMDPDAVRAKELSMLHQVPDALGIRLVAPNAAGIMDGSGSYLSYASLDLMSRALEERKVSALQAHRVAQPDVHLGIAGPVFDGAGAPLGVVYIALPLSLLTGAEDLDGSPGRILYQQRVGNEVVSLSPGQASVVADMPPTTFVEIPGTSLRIAVGPTQVGLSDNPVVVWVALGCSLSLLLAGLSLWVPFRRLKRALAEDCAGIVALVDEGVTRRPLSPLKCRVVEMDLVQEGLAPLLGRIGSAQGSVAGLGEQAPLFDLEAQDPLFTLDVDEADLPPSDGHILVEEEQGEQPRPTPEGGQSPPDQRDPVQAKAASEVPSPGQLAIFRAYDVRGVVGAGIDDGVMGAIGQAVANEVAELGGRSVFVARDTRGSSEALTEALVEGLRTGGCDVVDLGIAPTPLLYFATRYQGDTSGVMVTASHNPPEYNGCKIVLAGQSIAGEQMAAIQWRVLRHDLVDLAQGGYRLQDLNAAYVDHVERDVTVSRNLKVVVDCGNGAAALLAPALYRALGCEVVELHCDLDGGFPGGRVPDPSRLENVGDLIDAVTDLGADLGLGFDGDGDRLGVVDSAGRFVAMDRVLMLFAADVLSRHPGTDVIFDVKCTHLLAAEILRSGGRPVMWQSGHSRLKAKLRESGALLAGELSGHVIFQERWFGFDDAVYAGARLLELLALDPRTTAEVFATLPEAMGTAELTLSLQEGEAQLIMERVLRMTDRMDGVTVNTVDGLRAEFDGGWGLVRASNTQPALSFRFQGNDQESLEAIQGLFRRLMARVAPGLDLPF